MELARIFDPVMKSLMQTCSEEDLMDAFELIRKMYSGQILGTQGANINFSHNAVRSAYLYMYGPLHASLVSLYLMNLQTRCGQLFDRWFEEAQTRTRNQIDVCTLGGGPGLEMGCAYLWIEMLCQEWKAKRSKCQMLNQTNLTVCDINSEWRPVYFRLLEEFRKHAARNGAIRHVQPNFICSDLLFSFTPEIRNVIGRSDLVLMVKFLSAVAKQRPRCIAMLQNIMNSMKPGALLLVIDGRHRINQDVLHEAASMCRMNTIFWDEKVFTLNKDFYVMWKSTYGIKFGHKKPMIGCKIFVRILQKQCFDWRMTTTLAVAQGAAFGCLEQYGGMIAAHSSKEEDVCDPSYYEELLRQRYARSADEEDDDSDIEVDLVECDECEEDADDVELLHSLLRRLGESSDKDSSDEVELDPAQLENLLRKLYCSSDAVEKTVDEDDEYDVLSEEYFKKVSKG